MHIADGIIDTRICIAAQAASLGLIYLSGRRTEAEEIPRMGITGAALFVVSLIQIPFAGTSLHPGLFGLAGIILGKRAFPVIFTVLLFQSFIFQHGGLLTLGVNAINMGAGAFLAMIVWQQKYIPEIARALLAGFLGVFIPAFLMSVEFKLTGYGKGIFLIMSVYVMAALIESVITLTVVKFFRKVNSDIIISNVKL
ncbi:MAG: CbiM family transporter [Bacteroidales bacterium]